MLCLPFPAVWGWLCGYLPAAAARPVPAFVCPSATHWPLNEGCWSQATGADNVCWGLGGHRWWRRNKGRCWLLTDIRVFCSLTCWGTVEDTGCWPHAS